MLPLIKKIEKSAQFTSKFLQIEQDVYSIRLLPMFHSSHLDLVILLLSEFHEQVKLTVVSSSD